MIKQLFTCLLCCIALSSFSQLGSTSILGAKSLSMGGSGAASKGIQSIYFGQAGLHSVENFSAQVSSEQRYSLPELSAVSAGLAFRLGDIGVIGLFASNYGIDEYKDQKLGISYARMISERISIGTQIGLNMLRIEDYGSTQFISLDIGILANLTESITLAIHAANPASSNIVSDTDTRRVINLGLNYMVSDKAQILADYRHSFENGNSIHTGIQYQIVETLALRAGAETNPGTFSFGLSLNMGSFFSIDGGFSSHQFLGTTPGLSIAYEN